MRLAITRSRALEFLKAIGYKTAHNWKNIDISKKLLNISEMIDGVDLEKFPMKKLLGKIINADSIRIKSDDDDSESKLETTKMAKKDKKKKKKNEESTDEPTVEKKKKKKDKSGKKKKDKSGKKKDGKKKKDKSGKKKGKKKSSGESKGLDKFGCRKGTIKAQVNATLTKKSKTMATIQEEAGIENSQTGHLRDMVEAGHVVKTSKGYKLA